MHNIKSRFGIKDRILKVDYWQVSKSGKVLEFRVVDDIDTNPEKYRLGIIQIGRIIYKFESFAKSKKSKPQIQLFPNLTENKLAATVYWPDFLSSAIHLNPDTGPKNNLTLKTLHSISENYNLRVKSFDTDIDSDSRPDSGLHTDVGLWSASNQPFIWLKTGQFIEELMTGFDLNTGSDRKDIEIISPVEVLTDKKKSGYFQIRVSIPSV